MKLLEENLGGKLLDISLGDDVQIWPQKQRGQQNQNKHGSTLGLHLTGLY